MPASGQSGGVGVPVVDLLAGPELHAGVAGHVADRLGEVFRAVGRPGNIGMDGEGQDFRALARLGIELVELVDDLRLEVARDMVLDDHRGDVVELYGVGYRHE